MSKSSAERQKAYREKQKRNAPTVTESPKSVTHVTETVTEEPARNVTGREPSLQDYLDHPSDYAERAHPESLNWGPWMNADDLKRAGFRANRVPIPGDWDYEGVV